MNRFHGVYPALVTPVDDRGNIRTGALRDLMEWHLEVGVDGFYIAGGTGEGLLLTQDQRRALTEATVRAADGRAPIIVHVGHVSTRAAVDLARHAASAGADAVSAIPPIYYGTDPASIVGHYTAIASATPLPLIVYHIPAATHSRMTVGLMTELLRLPTVKGIKFSDYNHFLMRQIGLLGSDLLVYSGNDEVFLSGLVMGAKGGIGLTYNFMPQLFVGIYQAFHAGDLDAGPGTAMESLRHDRRPAGNQRVPPFRGQGSAAAPGIRGGRSSAADSPVDPSGYGTGGGPDV